MSHGLMPGEEVKRKELENLDPYELRAKALDEPLSAFELGRALFHLNQRRGFKSNRKVSDVKDTNNGKIRPEISELRRRIRQSGARTLGEYLHRRRRKGKAVRARPEQGLYPDRALYEEEFNCIRKAQEAHHPNLNEAAWHELADIIFHQRKLRPVDPGCCTFEPKEPRAPQALPIVQEFRLLQEVDNLRILPPSQPERRLTAEERAKVIDKLSRQQTVTFASLLKLLKLPGDTRFNLAGDSRTSLYGDKTTATLAKKKLFGKTWHSFGNEKRTEIVSALLTIESEQELVRHAQKQWGVDEATAHELAKATLPSGYSRLSVKALSRIVPLMREQGLPYHEAVRQAGYAHHSNFAPEKLLDRLPYYGEVLERHVVGGDPNANDPVKRYGRIANPTVHIGLNQLRRIINRIIERHGRPTQIVIELARELKMSAGDKAKERKRQALQRKDNGILTEIIEGAGYQASPNLLRRFKLWKEQGPVGDRRCPYTGKVISATMVMTEHVEVDHIIPFSRSLDDSHANKVLCIRAANQKKRNRTPYEAFGNSPDGYDYEEILKRAERLPANKRWRFYPDAMERFEATGDFLDRQLNETRYLSRISREYLSHICPSNAIWVTPGRLTALLRGKWGLNGLLGDANRKLRSDHRHHAIDALVTALTDRALLQRVARAAERSRHRLIDDMPEPWPDFDQDVRRAIDAIIVSHRPDHGTAGAYRSTSGALHNDTAYGIASGPDTKGYRTMTWREGIDEMKSDAELKNVHDEALRRRLQSLWSRFAASGGKWEKFADHAWHELKVRRVKLGISLSNPVFICDRAGKPYKAYKADANEYMEIYEHPSGHWRAETVRRFDANQPDFTPSWRRDYPNSRKIMRLHKNDMIAIGEGAERQIFYVVKLSKQNVILAEHNIANHRARNDDKEDPFRYTIYSAKNLKEPGARKIRVDELGRVYDPGPLS